jgi:hypothetical protein
VSPTRNDLREHRARTREYARERRQLNRLRREPSRTLDGVDIKLWANAESREDVAEAHALGAAGIGLYRTEFLFLNSNVLPDEEAQFRAYRDLVLGMTGRTVTIRTLDSGCGQGRSHRTGPGRRTQSRAGHARCAAVVAARRACSKRSCARWCALRVTDRCASSCR